MREFLSSRNVLLWIFSVLVFYLQSTPLWADETNQVNSIVRFSFQRGTNALGIADVELFDQEKPETVRNFLLYVRSGAYTNSFLHRCVPSFVVQGGGFSMTNPASSDRFSTYSTVTNYGRLTNEFLVGSRMSNVFGTLAMAKVGNDPDSATSQWFFNLGNNTTNLDTQNGGFTVFGRILETANTNDGIHVLEHFNLLSTNAGIVNLGTLLGSSYQVFSSLPVSYTNSVSRVPLNRELYYVGLSVLNDTNPPGVSAPAITIVSPPPNSLFTNQVVKIKGTASDDVEVARVVYRIGDGPWTGASGTTNWEVSIAPQPGFQTVTVQSIDWDGNYSAAASLSFLYQQTVGLQLQITGQGTVAGLTNGQMLSAGASYTATATPLKGNIFESWTGSITSAAPTITFLGPTNATNFTLTAKFITDPTPALAGTYNGLLQTLGPLDFDGAGFMALTMQSDGSFSGSILYHGGTYYYTGKFDPSGNATVVGPVGGVNRSISLTLQKLNPAGLISGTFSGTSSTTLITMERLAAALATTDAPTPGSYTFVIPSNSTNPPSATVPGGNGYGTGTIAPAGTLALSGVLGDGTAFSTTPKVTRLGKWPLYLTLDGGNGALWGWISFNTNQPQRLQANLSWIRTANGSAPLYPSGFSNQVSFAASSYAQPEPGKRIVDWVYGLARLTGTDLFPSITNVVKLTTNNTFQVLDPNSGSFQLTLDPPTGLVNGSFVHPWFGTTNSVHGSLLIASNYIRGQYQNGTQIGSLTVDMSPYMITQSISSVTLPALTHAMSEGGVLQFQGSGTIVLTNTLVTQFDTRLEANGNSIVLSGGGSTRLFEVYTNRAFSAVGITFEDGFHQGAAGTNGPSPASGGDGFGGGFLNLGGSLAFTNCVITNCVVMGGDAGLDSSTNSRTASGGRALGGAVFAQRGPVTLHNTTVSGGQAIAGGNRSLSPAGSVSTGAAAALGAGLFSDGGEVRLVDSTFFNNLAQGGDPLLLSSGASSRAGNAAGGAVAVASGSLRMANSKILTNSAAGPTMTHSAGSGHGYAGGLFLETNVTAVVEQSLFAGNNASAGNFLHAAEPPNGEGGAIFNAGSLVLSNCSLGLNVAKGGSSSPTGYGRGGALASTGSLLVNGSTFNENVARGGEFLETATSTVPGAEGAGGAIFVLSNSLTVTNSTFAYNLAIGGSGASPTGPTNAARGTGRGGAVMLSSGSASMVNLTLAFNEAAPGSTGAPDTGSALGGALANQAGTINLRSSVVASNLPANFGGPLSDLGYNISSDASAPFTASGSRTNTDPALSALSTNGGATRTMAILAHSPARDAVRGTFPATDQRGTARPQGTYADSGAFEFVQLLPVFTFQPSGTNVARYGTNVTFQALAIGSGQIGYSWLKDEIPILGAVSNVLTLTNLQPIDAGLYSAVATNSYGAVTSSAVTLVIDQRPFIVTQPADAAVDPGGATSLVVTAIGPALTYTWLHSQVPIPGATNATLSITDAAPGVEGAYQVIIINYAGAVTSRVASVSFSAAALAILTQPQNTTVAIGSPSTLTVLASGITPISYQWLKNSVPIPGETNTTLTFSSTSRTNGGTYRVVVANPFATLTSTNAVLSVVAQPVLSISSPSSSTVAVTVFGDPGRVHRLLSATNLAANSLWVPVATHTIPGSGSATWNLPVSTNSGPVFYRAVTP